MKRFTALAAVVSLFTVGVLVGGLAVHLYYARGERPSFGPPDRPPGDHFMGRLVRELDLTTEQRERLEEIMYEARVEADALHNELVPRVREHMARTEAAIRELLTPEQQAKFDELHLRHRERAERFFLGDGGRGRGRGGGPGRPRRLGPGPPPNGPAPPSDRP